MSRKFARLYAANSLRVGHHVQVDITSPGAVADDADLAVELDVVEVLAWARTRSGRWGPDVLEPACSWRKAALSSSVTLPSTARTSPSW